MMILTSNNPILKELRTMHPKMVHSPYAKPNILKDASSNSKLGKGNKFFTKGIWKGMPLYSLSLEERKTCPSDCKMLRSCYGNGIFLGHRFKHGMFLQQKLDAELKQLAKKYPKGFVVRLHVLGDFYSVKYVNFWRNKLLQYPNLYIFGYTARLTGDIHQRLVWLINEFSDRFKIRFSDNKDYNPDYPNIMYASEQGGTSKGLQCPEQTGKTNSCLTCGLCFGIKRTIAFQLH